MVRVEGRIPLHHDLLVGAHRHRVVADTSRTGLVRCTLGDADALAACDDHVAHGAAVVVVAGVAHLRRGLDVGVDALAARIARVGGGRLAVIAVLLVDAAAGGLRAPVRRAGLAVAARLLGVDATRRRIARVRGARILVVAVLGAGALADTVEPPVSSRAGVVVIAARTVLGDVHDALPARAARGAARTVLDSLAAAGHRVARVGGALLPVVARLRDVRAARGCVARVGGAGVAVVAVACGRLVLAHTVLDDVDGACDAILALWLLHHVVAAGLRVAVVGGVCVVVVAAHLLPHAFPVVPAVAGRALVAVVARVTLLRARGAVGLNRVLLGRLVGVLGAVAAVVRVRGVRGVRPVAAVVRWRLVGVVRRRVVPTADVSGVGLSAHAADRQEQETSNHRGLHVRLLGATAPHSLVTRMIHAPCAHHVCSFFNETWSDSHRCDVFQTSGSRCVAKEGTLHTEPNDCKTSRNEQERIPYLAQFVKGKKCLK